MPAAPSILVRSDAPGDRIAGCRFFANETTQQGGALYLYRYQGQLEDTLFSGNRSSTQEGGAIGSYYGSPQLRRVIATGNTSAWRGGAVYVAGHPSYPASPRSKRPRRRQQRHLRRRRDLPLLHLRRRRHPGELHHHHG